MSLEPYGMDRDSPFVRRCDSCGGVIDGPERTFKMWSLCEECFLEEMEASDEVVEREDFVQ